jgi:hypothetical protein
MKEDINKEMASKFTVDFRASQRGERPCLLVVHSELPFELPDLNSIDGDLRAIDVLVPLLGQS